MYFLSFKYFVFDETTMKELVKIWCLWLLQVNAHRDKFLFVHLRANDACAKKYMSFYKYQNEKELQLKIWRKEASREKESR